MHILRSLLCFVLLCIVSTNSVQAQNLSVVVDKKGRIGFSDQNGNIVIQCQYESASPFKNGMSIVMKSGKSGMIDETGKVLLPIKYSRISSWNDKLYLVNDGKKSGLVNSAGTIVLNIIYTQISRLNCYGKALIALGGKFTKGEKGNYYMNAQYGIIDKNGTILIKPEWKGLYEFAYDGKEKFPYYEGLRLMYSDHYTSDTLMTDCKYIGFSKNLYNIYKAGIMDEHGVILVNQGLYTEVMMPKSGMVRFYNYKNKKETICGYHNISTNSSFQATTFKKAMEDLDFWSHGDFIGDIAPVNGTDWAFIDKTGKKVREGYTLLKHNEPRGLWAAKNSTETWDVFDDNNKNIPSLSNYKDIEFPFYKDDDNIFTVQKGNLYGVIDFNGSAIIPFEYEKATSNKNNFVAVKRNGKWGLVTSQNAVVCPTSYADVTIPNEKNATDLWIMKSDSLWYHMNTNRNTISSQAYTWISNFEDGIALAMPKNVSVDDNIVNRAQIFAAKATKQQMKEAEMTKYVFGQLINSNDEILFSLPITTMYKKDIIEKIKENGSKTLSLSEQKNILLEVTKSNRSYDMNSLIAESEWNY